MERLWEKPCSGFQGEVYLSDHMTVYVAACLRFMNEELHYSHQLSKALSH